MTEMNDQALGYGAATKTATTWREWIGWTGTMLWFFHMNNAPNCFPDSFGEDDTFWMMFAFKLVFAVSVLAFGLKFGRDPNALGRLASFTAPVAIALTVLFTLLPNPGGGVLFALASAFIAPVMVRRAYGVVRTARPGYTLTTFMSGVAVGFAGFRITDHYYDTQPETEIYSIYLFFIFAAFIVPAWSGVRRSISVPGNMQDHSRFTLPKPLMFALIGAVALTFWLLKMKSLIDYAVEEFDDILYVPVYAVIPCVAYVFLGFMGDRNRERTVVIVVAVLYIISIQLAFLGGGTTSPAVIPLVFTNHFFGHIIEYFLYVIPIYFFAHSKQPVFAASFGVSCYMFCWAFRWVIDPVLPEALKVEGVPMFIATAIPAIVFFIALNFVFQRYREKTLGAALYALIQGSEPLKTQGMSDAGLTQTEIDVAMLLIDGTSKRDISRKLNMNASELGKYSNTIREKLNLASSRDPVVSAVAAEYKLTKREAEMLGYLQRDAGNSEIAHDLFLSDETIRGHVRHVLQKLSIENRHEVAEWLRKYKEKI